MNKYKIVKLGDVLNIQSSSRIFEREYVNHGIPFYRSKEIIEKHNGNDVSTSLFISEERFNKIKRTYSVPKHGDILLTSVGTIGIPYVVRENEQFYFKDGNLTWFNNFSKEIDNLYFYYWLLSNAGKEALNSILIGTTQKALTIKDLKNLEISLPPLSSQHRIANILSSFDNKIELLRKENNTLEDIAQSIFKEWFVKAKEQEQIEVSNLIEFNPQLSLKTGQISWYIEMADLSTNSSSISRIVKRSYTSGSKFQNNDVLFARVTPCLENGKTGIVKGLGSEDIGWGSTEFIVMRGKDSILYPFVYCLARENQFRQFAQKEMIGTSGRQRVPVNKLQSYLIPKPSAEKLSSFNQISLSIFDEIEKNSREAEILIKMKNNLLKKLIQ